MNNVSQSNSLRPYSKNILEEWHTYFAGKQPDQMNFLEQNAYQCLQDFESWAPDFEAEAKKQAAADFDNTTSDEASYQKWLEEKISKALDVYWSPLSLAMTQYTSPAYKAYIEHLLSDKDFTAGVDSYLQKVNALFGRTGTSRITMNDILFFFDELTLIRRPPFTRMALISTPFRVIDAASDSIDDKLTGIAHELGHFLFWHMDNFDNIRTNQKRVVEDLCKALAADGYGEEELRFVRSWIEELFSDLIATKIARAAYVQSSQDMVVRNNKSSSTLGDNDYKHVPDALRPLVSLYTFEREQHPDQDTDASKTVALRSWRQFFQQTLCADLSKIVIWHIRSEPNERTIKRSPEQLSQLILDTVDWFLRQIDSGGLFRSEESVVTSAAQLASKAQRILPDLRASSPQKDMALLDLFLNPVILEGEEYPHSHSVTVVGPSSHGSNQLTLTHSHS